MELFARPLSMRYDDPLDYPYRRLDVHLPLHYRYGPGPRVVHTPELMPYPGHPDSRPEFPTSARIKRKYLDFKSLDRHALSWEVDKYDPGYIIISQYTEGDFQNTLCALTKGFKKSSKRAKRGCSLLGIGSRVSSPSKVSERYHSISRSRRPHRDLSPARPSPFRDSVLGYVDSSDQEDSTVRRDRSRGRSSAIGSTNEGSPWSPLHNSTRGKRGRYANPARCSSDRPSDSDDCMRDRATIFSEAAARAARRAEREPGNIVIELINPSPDTAFSIKNNLERGVHVIMRQQNRRDGSWTEDSKHIEAGRKFIAEQLPDQANPPHPRCSNHGTRLPRPSARLEFVSDKARRPHLSMDDYCPRHQRSFRRIQPFEEDLAPLQVYRDDGSPNPNDGRELLDRFFRRSSRENLGERQRRGRETQPRPRGAEVPRIVMRAGPFEATETRRRPHGLGINTITGEINDSTGEISVRMPGGKPVFMKPYQSYKVKVTGSRSASLAGSAKRSAEPESNSLPAGETESNDKGKSEAEDDTDVKEKGRARAATVTEEVVIAKDFGAEETPILTSTDRDTVEADEGLKHAEVEDVDGYGVNWG